MSGVPRSTRPDAASATPDGALSWASRRAPWLLFGVSFLVYAATAARGLVSLDVRTAYIASWRIASSGVPWIEGLVLPDIDTHPFREVWVLEAANGHTVIGRSPGVVASGLPGYWLFGSDGPTNTPGALTAALLTAAAVTLMFLALRVHLAQRHALLCAAVFGFATPVWSIAANGLWPHTLTVLGIAGMAWAAARDRWWLVGLFGGVVVWGRLHAAIVVAVLGLLVGIWRRQPGIVAKVGVVSVASLVPMSLWTRWMYGDWNPMSSYDTSVFTGYAQDNRLSVVNHLGFWVSPDRGLFVWTPVVLLLLPALVRSWRSLPDWSRALAMGGLAYTLVQLTFNRFSGGDNFYGYRLGLELLAAATPALALSSLALGSLARRLMGPVLGLQLLVVALGASIESFFVAADDVWTRNAFVNALALAPGIIGPLVVLFMVGGWLAGRAWQRSGRVVRREAPVSAGP